MGPFPHDAPPAQITPENPAGTDGFGFVEYAHPEPEKLHALFKPMGFEPVARHRTKAITLYQQGDVNYLVNEEPGSHAARFAAAHGPCAPSMAFRVVDAEHAYRARPGAGGRARRSGRRLARARRARRSRASAARCSISSTAMEPRAPRSTRSSRGPEPPTRSRQGQGLFYLDHLTHNVGRGRMDLWAGFYERLFNFREIRYFDIKGEYTGLFSRALTSPDGKIRIPINESADEQSQIEEYLHEYKGEGIQHIACGCRDIYATIEGLRERGLAFMPSPPSTYYERVDERVPGHGEDLARLQRNGILLDGEGAVALGEKEGRMTKVLCSSSRPTRSGRSSSSSSSARATRASARATSAPSSSRSRRTSSAAAC